MICFPPKVRRIEDQQKNQQKHIAQTVKMQRPTCWLYRERKNSSYFNESKWHLSVKFGLTRSHSALLFCSSASPLCISLPHFGERLQQSPAH